MVDVFDRHGVRFDPRLTGCSRFVRYSDYAALEAQLAETKADRDDWIDRCRASVMAFDEQKARAAAQEAGKP